MAKIKIVSNPYERQIHFSYFDKGNGRWEDIREHNVNSRLREIVSEKAFFPFKIKEMIDIIIAEYDNGTEKTELLFEGTADDYMELENACRQEHVREKLFLSRTEHVLENARDIFDDIKEIFERVHPVIRNVVSDDANVIKDLNKVSDTLNDIIPICVFGNYSAGKSTFINALIGGEILPSGGDPITARVYKIVRSSQADRAKVRFEYKEENTEFSFEGLECRVTAGDTQSELAQQVMCALEECKKPDMFFYIKCALETINNIGKKDKDSKTLGSVIELEIPFAKNGVLGQSHNHFVIFDTPGSNSATNAEHAKVLFEALEGFSNGIPVWVSQYDTIDSEDNASLCDKIFEIKALDNRFTMIVLNKADSSDLPEDGFSEEHIKEILEYAAVEKMYAAGIYFVSSIMGLGAKKNGELTDKHYRKTYRLQEDMFADPEDEDYMVLYDYNIMPEQLKNNAASYSEKCHDRVYANSGLYCVESEMENFASKHAAYNKCQMVYMFLNSVIEESNKRISGRVEKLDRRRGIRTKELENSSTQLIDSILEESQGLEKDYEKDAKIQIKGFLGEAIREDYSSEKLDLIAAELQKQNEEENQFSEQEENFEKAKDSILDHLKSNTQEMLKGNLLETVRTTKDDLVRDFQKILEHKRKMDLTEDKIDEATSDSLIEIVTQDYKENMMKAKDFLNEKIKEIWVANAQMIRRRFVEIVTGSEALSTAQSSELSDVIINYQGLEFDDHAEDIFIKDKFLQGMFFGFKLMDNEKLNTKKLSDAYNDKIRKNIQLIAEEVNDNCFASFRSWEQTLTSNIEANITKYNPELRDMAELIQEESEKITELENYRQLLLESFAAIKSRMDWKVLQ